MSKKDIKALVKECKEYNLLWSTAEGAPSVYLQTAQRIAARDWKASEKEVAMLEKALLNKKDESAKADQLIEAL